MALRIGEIAPDFKAESTQGIISFHRYIQDHWAILFSHPSDFTPVCTSELGMVAKLKVEFEKRNTKVLGISAGTLESHKRWIIDIEETQETIVDFPVIADPHKKVVHLYDMIHPFFSHSETIRSVFIIDPGKRIKSILIYPANTGRNFHEILRMIDSLQLTESFKVATPANWEYGKDCFILPAVKDEELATTFPRGFKILKPYLRTTPQPNL
ncbi:peroxiredoxin [Adhaeribacter swui]|uniref:Alkyl hydroperoxide reductase C n=1 Tax=Adhaeribacter swui TaxID=2086471 RepID=A0A7G7G863_9BACT|nr:peroxiredoxin [Adhaeribacter swui]QNF33347.1 peroxiredoxin [Adhaeribacter swui]